ncbi:Predicted nucleotide-binding protein containing TIR-like domain-containing protein [Mucilaginibacter lappiensis]|uniref:CD-NTase-associated protein 12/Pycsar effector protein TIR domain-containing protein n=1 Tax=Mucilaginibacter lappiensis TaxID=354630 RepID=A0ABR6PSC1_9SPHI|nr:nucleotide-binding protein [Mucilaginibacter lappiensis]MBB6112521.1 hypothetical protein [Mucilaginibacter lappiensis]SIS02673.1 Predicted nucleotide-binding protein containing TIR-like domain-containing protein [Mucilaginibacter lappiensis]
MKPRLFIGSSTENLEIANALQVNLEYDAIVTVWNQGVFNISSNALNDLMEALDSFDFAIFIFQPDDITTIRNNKYQTVRDNIIFELGLFLGRLGKEKVFYLTDRETTNLHLPTDLIGLSPGTYDSKREDNNLQAALGPFCFEVRKKLKAFLVESLIDFKDETMKAKKLAAERPDLWEFDLAIELLDSKLKPIKESYSELEKGLLVRRLKSISNSALSKFYEDSLTSFIALNDQFMRTINELKNSFGPLGVAGNALEIKNTVQRLVLLCKELLSWEYEVYSISPSDELMEVKTYMQGWSSFLVDHIYNIGPMLKSSIDSVRLGESDNIEINLTIDAPSTLSKPLEIFQRYLAIYGSLD